ncbi:hypothetical protein BSFP_057060 [Burkholderia stabilis]|uniref:HTH araC/xylS-type domain-containing protein n=1 Tax=Burkholderia stabilis TaxID=95485 RepID=A0A1Y1BWV6_9BURK|nr:hypothetical protein BSFP_057060 [Burkholderia stabilis]
MSDLRNVTDTPKGAVGPTAFHQIFRLNRYYSCVELAHALGNFDQTHFTREFRNLVGKAPAEYRRDDGRGR